MIASRVEIEVSMDKMDEAIKFQKGLFAEGGPYHGQVESYRVHQAFFSGQNNIIAVEVCYESLGAFESAHLEGFKKLPADFWENYRKIFDKPQRWTHWIVEDAG